MLDLIRPARREMVEDISFEEWNSLVNARRTQLVGIAATVALTVQAFLGVARANLMLALLSMGGAAIVLSCALVAIFADRLPWSDAAQRLATMALLFTLLLASLLLAAVGGPTDAPTNGFAIVVLGLAALFEVSTLYFAAAAITTFLALSIWVMQLGLPLPVAAQSLCSAAFALAAAIMSRRLIYRSRERSHYHQTNFARQNKAFRKTAEDLAASNHQIREIMAIAAHDLRSPLLGLHNLLDLATDRKEMNADMTRRLFVEAGRSVKSMLALTNQLLGAHEADSRGALDRTPHDLHALAAAAHDRVRVAAMAVDVTIELIVERTPLMVVTHQLAVARILDNLLSNAVKYSRRGATVYLACRQDEGRAAVEVIDEGIGIDDKDRRHLFEKFHRGGLASMGAQGAGLGLYIAKTSANAIGAELDYMPRLSGGSVFKLSFPIAADAP